jgi:hypothetical protein
VFCTWSTYPKAKIKVVSLGLFILGEWALYFCIYDKQEGIRNHMVPTLDTIIFKYLFFFLFYGRKRGSGGGIGALIFTVTSLPQIIIPVSLRFC